MKQQASSNANKIEEEKTQKLLTESKTYGIGFCLVPLFKAQAANGAAPPQTADLTSQLYQGTPRVLLAGALDATLKRLKTSGSSLTFAVLRSDAVTQAGDKLLFLVPQDTLVGPRDVVPGLVDSKLPFNLEAFKP